MIVNEIFLSIQGEGKETGLPTVFIRLTGCNLRCKWCDTEYAFTEGKEMEIEDVVERAGSFGIKRACITGGEPLLQKETSALISELLERGYDIVLETNGSLPIDGIDERVMISMDWKTPSSGEEKSMLESNLPQLREKDQLKFVIADDRDYEYALSFLRERELNCEVIFQPLGGTNLRWLAERVIEDRVDVRVLPQLHKIIWGKQPQGTAKIKAKDS